MKQVLIAMAALVVMSSQTSAFDWLSRCKDVIKERDRLRAVQTQDRHAALEQDFNDMAQHGPNWTYSHPQHTIDHQNQAKDIANQIQKNADYFHMYCDQFDLDY